ncbi:MAG: hypothetical protein FWE10_03220 [Rikenellaceae bacterium]|nr:hypothetical protein [Rikenellaceae bacterium]MCL2693170.1 hypothetical protein [Rikenellaceae bacterium]
MDKNLQHWQQKTNPIWIAVLLFAIGGALYPFASSFHSVSSSVTGLANTAAAFTGGKAVSTFSIWGLLKWVFLLAALAGYALFIISLGNFRTILDAKDGEAVGKVRTGALLHVVAYLCLFLGMLFWTKFFTICSSIVSIIAFIMMLMGYSALKNSSTFPAKARKGASHLFLSMILSVVAIGLILLLGWIPILGAVIVLIAGIIALIAYIFVFVGWAAIKNADPKVLA